MKYFTNKLTPINSFVSNEGIYRGQLMTAIFKRTPYSSLIDLNCYHVIYDEKTHCLSNHTNFTAATTWRFDKSSFTISFTFWHSTFYWFIWCSTWIHLRYNLFFFYAIYACVLTLPFFFRRCTHFVFVYKFLCERIF